MKRGEREKRMEKSALVVIDLQNDITKNYRDIIDGVNEAIRRAEARGMEIVYIRHNNLSAGTRTFKPGTHGEELVPELRVASEHCFVKSKSSALTSEADKLVISSLEPLAQALPSALALNLGRTKCSRLEFLRLKK